MMEIGSSSRSFFCSKANFCVEFCQRPSCHWYLRICTHIIFAQENKEIQLRTRMKISRYDCGEITIKNITSRLILHKYDYYCDCVLLCSKTNSWKECRTCICRKSKTLKKSFVKKGRGFIDATDTQVVSWKFVMLKCIMQYGLKVNFYRPVVTFSAELDKLSWHIVVCQISS